MSNQCTSTNVATMLLYACVLLINTKRLIRDASLPHVAMWGEEQCTLTGRCTPRPVSCSLTCLNIVSNQPVPCTTTVVGCLSICCSSSVMNTAIDWVSQNTTVYNCEIEGFTCYALHTSSRVQTTL